MSSSQVAMIATDYEKLTHREQVRLRPGMYVGSIRHEEVEEWVYDFETNIPVKRTNTIPEAVKRCFFEILSNAGDAAIRSKERGFDPKQIEVEMNDRTITITNYGCPIPVEMHPEHNELVPVFIFSDFLSSSNYKKGQIRKTAGLNGVGAKAVFVFSTEATVFIQDHINKKEFTQVHRNGLQESSTPKIVPFKGNESMVRITYTLDFPFFDMEKYDQDVLELFARYTMDYSLSCHIPTRFNEIHFNVESTKMMASYYMDQSIIESCITYDCFSEIKKEHKKGELPPQPPPKKKGKSATEENNIEMCILDTPFEGRSIGFVNGLMVNLGVHVDAVYKEIADVILPDINEQYNGKSLLTIKDIKHHISIVLNCQLPDPEFNSQSKNILSSPTPKLNIPLAILLPIKSWKIVERLKNLLEQKENVQLAKTDGKKTRHVNVRGLTDANFAGTNKSHTTILYLTEGNSAANYASKARISNDLEGVFGLRGKLLNVTNASIKEIAKNHEIENLKEIIGLKEKIDYSDDVNFKKLRYGKIRIMTDADYDGKHIAMLIYNFFNKFYPSLTARGFVEIRITPIVRGWKGTKDRKKAKQVFKFYTNAQLEEWKSQTPDWKDYHFKYYKGLATSTDDDIEDDSKDIVCPVFKNDDHAIESLRLAFDRLYSEQRKEWLKTWNSSLEVTIQKEIDVTDYINKELIHFAMVAVARSIPSFCDGLKESQRKILLGVFNKWTSYNSTVDEVRVSQLGSYISENIVYHYGDASLAQTIIAMTQDFVGALNLRFFEKGGQFGSRKFGGKDSGSARYIFVKPERYLYEIFKPEDKDLLEYLQDEDGKLTEPKFFLPIIPMWAVNGSVGIGTGYSSFIPNYNPEHIAAWLISKMDGTKLPVIKPWYRGFKGKLYMAYNDKTRSIYQDSKEEESPVVVVKKRQRGGKKKAVVEPISVASSSTDASSSSTKETEEETEESIDIENPMIELDTGFSDDSENLEKNAVSLISEGTYSAILHTGVTITELPLGKWTNTYLSWLKEMLSKKQITDIVDKCNDKTEAINIFVSGLSDPSIKRLRLCTSMGLNNMVLLDEHSLPLKCKSIEDWLHKFYDFRLPYYHKRRELLLSKITDKIRKSEEKKAYLTAVINGKVNIFNQPKVNIIKQCEKQHLSTDYISLPMTSLTKEDLEDLNQLIAKLKSEYIEIEKLKATDLWKQDLNSFVSVYRKTIKKK